MQEYEMTVKDDDGQIYIYRYHKFQETETGHLMIYRAGSLNNEGTREMVMTAKFKNHSAILEIVEVDDEG